MKLLSLFHRSPRLLASKWGSNWGTGRRLSPFTHGAGGCAQESDKVEKACPTAVDPPAVVNSTSVRLAKKAKSHEIAYHDEQYDLDGVENPNVARKILEKVGEIDKTTKGPKQA